MPQDKFIFVNAPTIVNAGPRDARRELRSQLMRRVYLKKQTPNEDRKDPEQGSQNSSINPPSDYDESTKQQYTLPSRSPPARLLTPPNNNAQAVQHDDSRQARANVGRKRIPKHTVQAKNRPVEGRLQRTTNDPKQTLDSTFLGHFYTNFDSKLGPNCQVLVHHYTRVMLPAVRVANHFRQNIFIEHVQASPSPLLFQTVCLMSSIHLDKLMLWNAVDAQRHRREYEQKHYKYVCLRELRQALAKPQYVSAEFDSILMALSMLALCDPVSNLAHINSVDYNPFYHALQSLGGLGIFGYEPMHRVHWAGMLTLIEQSGGFDKIRMYAVRFHVSYAGIKNSIHTNTKPPFPICNDMGESLVDYTPLEILQIPPSSLPPFTGSGFLELKWFSIRDSILQTFVELGELAHCMHILMPYRDDTIVRDRLHDARNLVQYNLSNLPLMTDDPSLIADPDESEPGLHPASIAARRELRQEILEVASIVYGMCWLVTHLFTTHITFTVPSCRRFRLKTVPPLRDIIVNNTRHSLKQTPAFMRLQLWCVVICGIAAEDLDPDHRPWMVQQTRDLCINLGLREWEQVTLVMKSFAWMESACGHGGRKLWAEVQNLTMMN